MCVRVRRRRLRRRRAGARRQDYELARSHPGRFIVAPGHVVPEIERVVVELDGACIVEKHPGQREIPIATDPRA